MYKLQFSILCLLLFFCGEVAKASDFDPESPLFLCIRQKNIHAVRALIDQYESVDITDCLRNTPLHVAAEYGCYRITKALISAGVLVNPVNAQGKSALHIATCSGRRKIVGALILAGASIRKADYLGQTVWHEAAGHKDHQMMLTLIYKSQEAGLNRETISKAMNQCDNQGKTALHIAVLHRKLQTVELLTYNDAALEQVDHFGMRPLHYAVQNADYDIISSLVSKGASVSAVNHASKNALQIAESMLAQIPQIDVFQSMRENVNQIITLLSLNITSESE